MRNLNIEMLKTRIYNLMQENRITQETLSDAIGMTQPNFSRALSLTNSQCFTVEQIFKIAQYFDVSVDYLLDNVKPMDKKSERDICKFFTALLEKRTLVKVDFTRNEEIATPDFSEGYPDSRITHEDISYHAFIFPKNTDPGPLDRFDEDQIDNLHSDYLYFGSKDESNCRINAFFDRYLQIYDMYVRNQMTEELFHEIAEKFMDDLK